MQNDKKKKILIVGNSAKEHALALKFHQYDNIEKIFVAPGNDAIKEIAETVDIREENIQELLKFVIENEINLTIASSETAIKNDIADVFQANGQMIFAPSAESAKFAINKAFCKKFLYKLHIPTPRFGIFEKAQAAYDFLNEISLPVVIRTEETINGKDRLACPTLPVAKTFVEDLFARDEKKVLIEEYVYGHEFTLYAITDGYQALPLCAAANYKFMSEGDGGLLTNGIGAFAPDYKISNEIIDHIMQNVVRNILNALERQQIPYLGILGIDCVLKNDGKYSVLEFKPFFQDHDCACILDLIEQNLYTLFEACAIGSFADDYEYIELSENAAVSCVVSAQSKGKIINGLDLIEDSQINHFNTHKNSYLEYETLKGKALTLTASAKTLNRAKKKLYADIEQINFDGKKYRKDICSDK